MKSIKRLLLLVFVMTVCVIVATAQISGTVFRDFNGNGVKNNSATFNEPFVQGVTVKATLSSGVFFTTTTNASGAYSFTVAQIPATTPVRIEFSGLVLGDFSSVNGSGNGTNVQFATAPSATVNFAVNAPDDYWNNTAQSNPKLLAIAYAHGDINHTNSAITSYGILQIDNNTNGHTPTIVNVATQAQVGSLWGMGYQKTHDRYFFANFLKRHVGFGPKGVGGVYMANLSGANYALSGSFTLQGVLPSNSATALDMGSVNRVSTPNTSDFYLATGSDAQGKDLDAFGKAGKVGFGDIEVDDKNQQLVLINLNQRRIITVDVSGSTASLNNASAATLSPLTKAYDILSLPGIPSYNTSTQGQLRPFALKIYKGRGYLGITGDASVTPRDSTNLIGYILSFDPTNIAAGFTTEITLNLNYKTSSSNGNTNRWHSWADVWSDVRSGGLYRYPEPLISDLEFDENGGMNISILDRFCHQMGVSQTEPVAGSATVIGEARESGDILHACRVGSSWIMEGSAGSCTPANTVDNADGYGDGQTVGVREWYDDQSGDNNVGEFTQGAMAKLMGTNLLVQTMQDPTSAPNTTGEPYYYSAGMHWFDVNTGGWSNWTSVYDGSDAGNPGGGFLKGNGLGDIEFAIAPAPIQIGNRIWLDANDNGIQDAGETTAGVPNGTTVTLRSPGINGTYGDGDDQSWTTTTDAAGNYYFSTLSSADNRKPTSWTGVGNTILPGYNYRIEVTIPANNKITLVDAGGAATDNIDNDAALLSGSTAFVNVNTSNINHNYDFGFTTQASLGNKVWLDMGAGGGTANDGIQNGSEPGVAGISVLLYRSTNGTVGDGDDVLLSSTVTDAYGLYQFNNLTAGLNYFVKVLPPANYSFSTQTNTGNDQGSDATGSDVNGTASGAGYGASYMVVLTSGESEQDIDAGLVLSQPITQSIGDRVWFDVNNNGVDNNEPGMAGVTVILFNGSGVPIASTITDANGFYNFTNLPTGSYQVGITSPAGFTFATYNAGGGTLGDPAESNTDSDVPTNAYGVSKTPLFVLDAGEKLSNIDIGLVATATNTASVGDFIWNDLDQDGIQDAGEPGIAGVTVTLYAADGTTVLATTVTDAFGGYMFTGLPGATSYVIGITLPGGYTVSPQNAGGNQIDSDISAVTFKTSAFNLPTGVRNLTQDAGLYQTSPAGTARLGDKVWFDNGIGGGTANDGIQNGTEPGVGGVIVTLYRNGADGLPGTADDILVNTTTTDANGNYQFVNLAASAGATTEYNVGFSNLPPGYSLTPVWSSNDANATNSDANPGTGRTGTINLTAGESEQDVDAGLVAGVAVGKGSLGNKVFIDLDGDGIQDAGETGVASVTVTLQKDLNNDGDFADAGEASFATQTTNSLGEYLFTGLDAGNYRVVFSNGPTGYNISTANAGSNDATDSDGNNAGSAISSTASTTGTINLAVGEDNLTVDLGIVKTSGTTGSISDRVWFDINNDGDRDAAEPGIAGVTVTLYDATGAVLAVTTTDANGYYLFDNLAAKITATDYYQIGFSNYPAGLVPTTQTAAILNDFSAGSGEGKTQQINLTAGQNRTDVDFGLTSTRASLGNFIWLDNDGDGVQDAGEPGISGVSVLLYFDSNNDGDFLDAGENVPAASMITDQNGQYLFTNLNAGNYQVEFTTVPIGLNFTVQNTPGDNGNNTNNDANSSGRTATIVLSAAEADLTIDAGLYKPTATVGNYIWADNNNNNVQDAGDQGVAGVLVTLYTSVGVPVSTAVTDKNGQYLFTNVPPGNYYVGFSNTPNGALFVTADQGGNDALDSDVNNTNGAGTTATFSVPQATVNITIDAGLVYSQALPVRVQFKAYKRNTTSELVWIVSGDITDAKNYILERSADGRNYTSIISLQADTRTNYQQFDVSPLSGINYYRIRIEYVDGKVEYSEVRIIRFDNKGIITIFPNPASSVVNVSLPDSWQGKRVTMEIVNQLGQIVVNKSQSQANQVETIDISRLARGSYILKLFNSNEEVEIRKVQVMK